MSYELLMQTMRITQFSPLPERLMTTTAQRQPGENPIRVFLLEDDPDSGPAILRALQKRGFAVTLATTYAEAISVLCDAKFDALVLDVRLDTGENKSGTDVLAEFRKTDPDCPVFMISAYHTIESIIDSVTHNASRYFLKPFDSIDELAVPLRKAVFDHKLVLQSKANAEQLRRSQQELQSILSSMQDLVFVFDEQARFKLCYAPLKTSLYSQQGKFLGKKHSEIMPECVNREFEKAFALNQKNQVAEYEYALDVGGHTQYWQAKLSPIIMDNVFLGSVAVIRDVTDRAEADKRLRELSADMELAEEKERQRLAADIHDSIGTLLAMSQDQIAVLKKSVQVPANSSAERCIGALSDMVTSALQQVKQVSFELCPPSLYEVGLEAALQDLCARVKEHNDVAVTFSAGSKPCNADRAIRSLLFRSVREIIQNALKHAHASEISICLASESDFIRIVVENNGTGFDPSAAMSACGSKAGVGLFHVRQRTLALGGQFEVCSTPGVRGTRITLSVPTKKQGKT